MLCSATTRKNDLSPRQLIPKRVYYKFQNIKTITALFLTENIALRRQRLATTHETNSKTTT